MRLKKISLILTLLVVIFSLYSCNGMENKKSTNQLFAMDTIIDVTIYGENAEKEIQKCSKELNRLEKLFSVNIESSDIAKINKANGEKVKVSKDTINVLKKAVEISNNTDGDFDITVFPIVKLYGFTTGKEAVPTQKEIDETIKLVNYKDIKIDGDTVQLKKDMQIDLGGIAKGYTGEKLLEMLKNDGVSKAIISIGGNVQTVGSKSNTEDWKVGVQNPDDKSVLATLEVGETSVITSGAYQRNMTIDGKFYHHIIDPKTGKPSDSGLKSVTIINKDGTSGDALATALFVKGTKDAIEYAKDNVKNIEVVIIDEKNNIYVSVSLKDKFKLANENTNFNIKYI